MDGMYSTEEIKGSISILLVYMDGMYPTEEIKGSISILLVLWMGCTLQRRLKVVFLHCWSYGWGTLLKVVFLYCWSYGWDVLYRGD